MLHELKSTGMGYPKVLLLRKKEIQRQTFVIRENADALHVPKTTSSQIPREWIEEAEKKERARLGID